MHVCAAYEIRRNCHVCMMSSMLPASLIVQLAIVVLLKVQAGNFSGVLKMSHAVVLLSSGRSV